MPADHFTLMARGVSVERGDHTVLDAVDVSVTDHTRLAVVGPNGVGKTTLLRVLAGELAPDAGVVTRAPPELRVGLLRQELAASDEVTVRDHIAGLTGVRAAEARFASATATLAETNGATAAAAEYDVALADFLASGAADLDVRMEQVAVDIGLPTRLLDAAPHTLSGGEAARVGLAALMLSRYDIVLLDEPTNDLDVDGLAFLDHWVRRHGGGLVIVSHDRAFLERTASEVLEIDEHAHTARRFSGGWDAFVAERRRARELAEREYSAYEDQRDRLARRAQRQREWSAQGRSKAVRKQVDPDKFRKAYNVAQSEKLAGKAKATLGALDRLDEVDKPWESWQLRFSVEAAPRSASVVAALERAVLQRDEFRLGPVDLEIRWAERTRITGPNGSGKSTLIQALLGRLRPVSGRAMVGPGVVVGELDQSRGLFDQGEAALLPMFQAAVDLEVSDCRSVLAKFGLDADAVQRRAATLSPGERTRAQLALFQSRGVNLLVLDEPTNHLDLEAIEQLESALHTYDGTLLVVSHDRRFIDNLSVHREVDVRSLDPEHE